MATILNIPVPHPCRIKKRICKVQEPTRPCGIIDPLDSTPCLSRPTVQPVKSKTQLNQFQAVERESSNWLLKDRRPLLNDKPEKTLASIKDACSSDLIHQTNTQSTIYQLFTAYYHHIVTAQVPIQCLKVLVEMIPLIRILSELLVRAASNNNSSSLTVHNNKESSVFRSITRGQEQRTTNLSTKHKLSAGSSRATLARLYQATNGNHFTANKLWL